jgi:hypothetical protein
VAAVLANTSAVANSWLLDCYGRLGTDCALHWLQHFTGFTLPSAKRTTEASNRKAVFFFYLRAPPQFCIQSSMSGGGFFASLGKLESDFESALTNQPARSKAAFPNLSFGTFYIICCMIFMRQRTLDRPFPSPTRSLPILFLAAALVTALSNASTSLTHCYDAVTGKQEVVASSCSEPSLVIYKVRGATSVDHLHAGVM